MQINLFERLRASPSGSAWASSSYPSTAFFCFPPPAPPPAPPPPPLSLPIYFATVRGLTKCFGPDGTSFEQVAFEKLSVVFSARAGEVDEYRPTGPAECCNIRAVPVVRLEIWCHRRTFWVLGFQIALHRPRVKSHDHSPEAEPTTASCHAFCEAREIRGKCITCGSGGDDKNAVFRRLPPPATSSAWPAPGG